MDRFGPNIYFSSECADSYDIQNLILDIVEVVRSMVVESLGEVVQQRMASFIDEMQYFDHMMKPNRCWTSGSLCPGQ